MAWTTAEWGLVTRAFRRDRWWRGRGEDWWWRREGRECPFLEGPEFLAEVMYQTNIAAGSFFDDRVLCNSFGRGLYSRSLPEDRERLQKEKTF